MARPPTILCPERRGIHVQPSRGSSWRRGSSSADSHSYGRRWIRRSIRLLAPSAKTAAMTTWKVRTGAREAKRPARDLAVVTSHSPRTAMTNRPSVSSTTYQCRGKKKDGTKCLSRNRWLATIAQARSAPPTDATTISVAARAAKCLNACGSLTGGRLLTVHLDDLMRVHIEPSAVYQVKEFPKTRNGQKALDGLALVIGAGKWERIESSQSFGRMLTNS